MNFHGKGIKIFAGNSNPTVAKHIADALKMPLGKVDVKTFSDGEISVSLNESSSRLGLLYCSIDL